MRRASGEEGFVLFPVIWIVGLLAVVASTFAVAVRLHVKSEANLSGAFEAEISADGLVRLVAYRLASASLAETARGANFNGDPVQCAFDEVRHATISVQDQGGLIDLNRSSRNALAAIIEKIAGNNRSDAETLARAIADFRDADGYALGEGQRQPEESLIAGGPGMKNAPFQSVDEIEQVVPAANIGALKSVLTVHSRQDGVDPSVAPSRLKALLDNNRSEGGAAIPLVASQRRTFAIDAEVTVGDGSRFRRMAIVAILRDPRRPYAILEWRQGSGSIAVDGFAPRSIGSFCRGITFN